MTLSWTKWEPHREQGVERRDQEKGWNHGNEPFFVVADDELMTSAIKLMALVKFDFIKWKRPKPPSKTELIYSDATISQIGAIVAGVGHAKRIRPRHINVAELIGALYALKLAFKQFDRGNLTIHNSFHRQHMRNRRPKEAATLNIGYIYSIKLFFVWRNFY